MDVLEVDTARLGAYVLVFQRPPRRRYIDASVGARKTQVPLLESRPWSPVRARNARYMATSGP